jgi:hypothetical protein
MVMEEVGQESMRSWRAVRQAEWIIIESDECSQMRERGNEKLPKTNWDDRPDAAAAPKPAHHASWSRVPCCYPRVVTESTGFYVEAQFSVSSSCTTVVSSHSTYDFWSDSVGSDGREACPNLCAPSAVLTSTHALQERP